MSVILSRPQCVNNSYAFLKRSPETFFSDVLPPTCTNFQPVTLDKLQTFASSSIPVPSATDSGGMKTLVYTPAIIFSAFAFTKNEQITMVATDLSDNSANCMLDVKVKGKIVITVTS